MKYMHCSFAGSYPIECQILEIKDNFSPPLTNIERILKFTPQPNGLYYYIRFIDPNTEEITERWVTKDYMVKN